MSRAARVGAFIVATLAILITGVFIIGGKHYLFSSTYQLKAQFDNVVGLDAGADVQVGGVHSGTVRNIVLPHKPGEKVTVMMDLANSTHEIIKQDSVASIETEGLLGNQYMAISFGSPGKSDVRDGDMIAGEPPPKTRILVEPTRVITRRSTDVLAIVDRDVAAAVKFVRDHACDAGIEIAREITLRLTFANDPFEGGAHGRAGCVRDRADRRIRAPEFSAGAHPKAPILG